ncbi:MAG: AAA family ATPase [Candidatus Pacebacteria bacterium]|nr:AAA family ATPase [Candidatus Paceibacterota bacterium]
MLFFVLFVMVYLFLIIFRRGIITVSLFFATFFTVCFHNSKYPEFGYLCAGLIMLQGIYYKYKENTPKEVLPEEDMVEPEFNLDVKTETVTGVIQDNEIKTTLTFDDYVGGGDIKRRLQMCVDLYRSYGDIPSHILLAGHGGMGKSYLAKVFASEMGVNFIEIAAENLKEKEDFYRIMSKVKDGTILFLEECHNIDKRIAETLLYSVMQDFYYIDDTDTRVNLPKFTIMGATTDRYKLEPSFKQRFWFNFDIQPYTHNEMARIIQYHSDSNIEVKNAEAIAQRSHSIPRVAIGHLKNIEMTAKATGKTVNVDMINREFEYMNIDHNGLDTFCVSTIKLLKSMGGKPVGINSLASSIGVSRNQFEGEIQPILLQHKLLAVTSRGRCLTKKGMEYII